MRAIGNAEYEEWLAEQVEKVHRRKVVEHRHVCLPSENLCSPKRTATKMAGAHCRMCQRTHDVGPQGITRHHLVPESWFLGQPEPLRLIRNAHANIVPLCRACHDDVDRPHPVARERARAKLRLLLTQQEVAFAIQVRGIDWLDSEYPRE